MKGIYTFTINGLPYVGTDSHIENRGRLRVHEGLLRQGKHYNKKMQDAYNISKRLDNYKVLVLLADNCSPETRAYLENFYIEKLNSKDKGLNLVAGGGGVSDSKTYGENNSMSKITNEEFYELVSMLKEGKTNKEIGEAFGLHDRYVSLIRHKKRQQHLWNTLSIDDDYEPSRSSGCSMNKKLTFEQFLDLVNMINSGATNKEITEKFNLSSGSASRIRNKKYYKDWWDRVDRGYF